MRRIRPKKVYHEERTGEKLVIWEFYSNESEIGVVLEFTGFI